MYATVIFLFASITRCDRKSFCVRLCMSLLNQPYWSAGLRLFGGQFFNCLPERGGAKKVNETPMKRRSKQFSECYKDKQEKKTVISHKNITLYGISISNVNEIKY